MTGDRILLLFLPMTRAVSVVRLLASIACLVPAPAARAAIAIPMASGWLPVGSNPHGVHAGDCDGDGLPDLIAASFDAGTATVFRNDGAGSLRVRASLPGVEQASGAACGDFDGDGLVDAAVVGWKDGVVTIFRGAADGSFVRAGARAAGGNPRSLTVGDVDQDGRLDLLVASEHSNDLTVLFGDGQGDFPLTSTIRLPAGPQANRPRAAVVEDFDGDGRADIAVASHGTPSLRVLHGEGLGFALAAVPLPEPGRLLDVAAGDVDGDGRPDLVTLSRDAVVAVHRNLPSGGFTTLATFPVRPTARSVALADLNGDGFLDLALAFGDANALQIVPGVGPATFRTCGGPWHPFLCPTVVAGTPLGGVAMRTRADEAAEILALTRRPFGLARAELGGGAALAVTPLVELAAEARGMVLAPLDDDELPDAILALASERDVSVTVLAGLPGGGFAGPVEGASVCGNGTLEPGELCDDGNRAGRDGCGPTCRPELTSGVRSIAPVDLDGDGRLDLVTVDAKGVVRVFYGNGRGQFRRIATVARAARKTEAVVGDVDGDGLADVVLIPRRRRAGALQILRNDGAGGLVAEAVRGPRLTGPLLAGDFDRDGSLDLLAVQASRPKGLALLTRGADGPLGRSRIIGSVPPTGASLHAADFDEDGLLDLVASGGTWPLLLGTRSGPFAAAPPVDAAPLGEVALGDVDGDGHQDVASCDAGPSGCRVLYGSGRGRFSRTPFPAAPTVGRLAFGAAAADLDGDGRVDLVGVSRRDDRVVVHFDIDGSPGAPASVVLPTGNLPGALDLADLDGDGRMDVVVANEGGQDLSVFRNLGDRRFATLARFKLPATGGSQHLAMALGDVDGDGRIDVAVAQANAQQVTLLLNTGGGLAAIGSFATGVEPRGVALGDLNGDGILDVVTANRGQDSVSVLTSVGLGSFRRTDLPSGGLRPWDVVVPDLDGDGRADLVVVHERSGNGTQEGSVVTRVNDGTGVLGPPRGAHVRGRIFPQRLCAGDFDGDGRADVAVGSIYTGDVLLLHGAGDGTFNGDERVFPLGEAVNAVWCGDADGDGRTDVAFSRRRSGNVGVVLSGLAP